VAMGRPHIADALVSLGVVRDREEAFEVYLSPGRPAYVHRYAAPLEDTMGLVRDAGGVSVVAHPWGRYGSSSLQAPDLARLQALGLSGIEVDHQDHGPEQRERLRGIGRELGLVMTGSSDFHGAGKVDHDLGCNTTDPEQLERLVDLAQEAGRASGRRTPLPVRP
jgi:3',5'-nucleoside bisphosphate phosphatase